MLKKVVSLITIGVLFLIPVNFVFTQTGSDWSDVVDLAERQSEVAVKTDGGKMIYGILTAADDSGIEIQPAGKKRLSPGKVNIRRDEIKKVWRALLFVNQRNPGRGALIGAGVGTGIGFMGLAVADDPLAAAAIPLFALIGTGVGGTIGFFTRNKHKKRDLVYRR